MRWFLLSLIIIPMIFVLQSASAEEPPTIFFSGSEPLEETHTVFKYEDGLTFVILWNEDNLNWSIELENISLFSYDFSGEGAFSKKKGTRSFVSVHLNASAPAGVYNIIIDLRYTQLSGDTVTKRYEYPLSYVEPLRITRIILPSNTSPGFIVDIETYVFLSELTMKFDSDGDIDLDEKRIERRNVPPGNYSFKTKVVQSYDMDGGQQEVAYHLVAINGSHIIELSEYNINVNVVWKDYLGFSKTTWYIVLIIVVLLILIIVIYVRYLKRNRSYMVE